MKLKSNMFYYLQWKVIKVTIQNQIYIKHGFHYRGNDFKL